MADALFTVAINEMYCNRCRKPFGNKCVDNIGNETEEPCYVRIQDTISKFGINRFQLDLFSKDSPYLKLIKYSI